MTFLAALLTALNEEKTRSQPVHLILTQHAETGTIILQGQGGEIIITFSTVNHEEIYQTCLQKKGVYCYKLPDTTYKGFVKPKHQAHRKPCTTNTSHKGRRLVINAM